MILKVNFIFLITFNIVNAVFDYLNDQVSIEILEDGKSQYKLLQERGELPQYGECWKAAIEHIHESCNHLSENVQSDIALRITNCFLEMSGHDTYNCDLDKKPNLRGICINSMTDRAFNVYTEFYTHAQNICWFLRGQFWQEKMSDIALKVSKQLHVALEKHEILLERQNDSLQMQQRLLQHGQSLEALLNESRSRTQAVIDDIYTSTLEHQRLLSTLYKGLTALQSWLVGEISWFDTFLFYTGGLFVILAVTSAECSASARLPVILVLSANFLLERSISNIITGSSPLSEAHLMHETLQNYVWWCRRLFTFICIVVLCSKVYYYENYTKINNKLLVQLREQNQRICTELKILTSLLSQNASNSSQNGTCISNEKVSTESNTLKVKFHTPKIEQFENNVTPISRNSKDQKVHNGSISSNSPCKYNLRLRS